METSPLTLAHAHARSAALETRRSNLSAASEEHDLAAGEFSSAAKGTADAEAARVLKLLEQHHEKLSNILKSRHENPHPLPSQTPKTQDAAPPALSPSLKSSPTTSSPSLQGTIVQPPSLVRHHSNPQRELTSSIATNLATARGIPPNQSRRGNPASPTLSAQNAGGKMMSPHGRSRLREEATRIGDTEKTIPEPIIRQSTSKMPTTPKVEEGMAAPQSPKLSRANTTPADDPFRKFYSTFENLFTKLSAPLAFAGLPLTDEQGSPNSPKRASIKEPPKPKPAERATVDPDMTRLFSPAALRAIRDTAGPSFPNAAESFYVVPTTGGTLSYAGVLSRHSQSGSINSDRAPSDTTDDFVDARETPGPPSPEIARRRGRSLRDAGSKKNANVKTQEELDLENQGLRHLVDTLANRLHMWESHAQESHKTLQASLRALQPPVSPPPPLPGLSGSGMTSAGTPGTEEDKQELEERIKAFEKEKERLLRENEKLKGVVGRYRERWEKLKEGARERRAGGRGNGNEGENGKDDNIGA
ncbi:MAG: hypothetical protein M1834_004535 [Cirrosporium novae-zelandiae]|nr:MAG: hypothetical protein M1834_004535 [Cirrosporium novae-zelandiae]